MKRVSKFEKIPEEEFIRIVSTASSLSDAIIVMGGKIKGTSWFYSLKKRMDRMGISYEGLRRKGKQVTVSRNRIRGPFQEIPFENLFIEKSQSSRGVIKKRIIKYSIIPFKCESCGNEGKWMGKKLVLVLDHKNGVSNDHRLENLRFLCPNCNSQQETFSGRNLKKKQLLICGIGNSSQPPSEGE